MLQNSNPVSLESLAEAFCMTIANAYRLVEDGEKLLRNNRYLGAVGSFYHAIDEIVRAHLIGKAAAFKTEDQERWNGFWRVSENRPEKLRILESEVHANIFPDPREAEGAKGLLEKIKSEFVYVAYDPTSGAFVPPGEVVVRSNQVATLAKDLHHYVLRLFSFFNFQGLPTPQSVLQVFRDVHPEPDRAAAP